MAARRAVVTVKVTDMPRRFPWSRSTATIRRSDLVGRTVSYAIQQMSKRMACTLVARMLNGKPIALSKESSTTLKPGDELKLIDP